MEEGFRTAAVEPPKLLMVMPHISCPPEDTENEQNKKRIKFRSIIRSESIIFLNLIIPISCF
jgi:hypothetical protein